MVEVERASPLWRGRLDRRSVLTPGRTSPLHRECSANAPPPPSHPRISGCSRIIRVSPVRLQPIAQPHAQPLSTHFFAIHPTRPLHARPSTASLDPPIVGHRSCATIHALPSGRELVVGAHRRLASRVSALATVKARGRNGGPPTSGPTHPNLAHRRPARVPLEHIRLDQRSTYRLTRHLLPADARSPSMGRLPD